MTARTSRGWTGRMTMPPPVFAAAVVLAVALLASL